MKKVSIVLILVFVFVSCGGGQTKRNEQKSEAGLAQEATAEGLPSGAFSEYALSNRDGSKILIIESEKTQNREDFYRQLTFAIYNGKSYRVEYAGYKQGNTEEDNGRRAYYNFDNIAGALFRNLDGTMLPPDAEEYDAVLETILLVNQTFLEDNTIIPFTMPEEIEEASATTLKALEKKYGRKVKSAQKVISYGAKGENSFFSVQFENKGNDYLAIYMTETAHGERAYIEFPVTDDSSGYSVWRVDDGGEFMPPVISAIFKYGDSYKFLINDYGAEGVNTYFISQIEDNLLADVQEAWYSRYTAPV